MHIMASTSHLYTHKRIIKKNVFKVFSGARKSWGGWHWSSVVGNLKHVKHSKFDFQYREGWGKGGREGGRE